MENLLSERALLTHLTVRMWTGRVKDDLVTGEVQTSKKASSDSGSWWTYLIPKRYVNAIDNAGWRARCRHVEMTMPWMDGGHRILPADMILTYTEKMRECAAEFQGEVENFLKDYPQLVNEAKDRLGDLAVNKHFPTIDEIRGRFGIFNDMLPMPNAKDFRVDIGDEQVQKIRSEIEHNIEDKLRAAQNDLWNRLTDLVGKVHERLSDPDKKFRDSLMQNLKEFCNVIPKMNIVDDPNLNTMRDELLAKLGEWKPDDMRNNKIARAKAANEAKEVLDKMKDFFV